MCHNDINIDNVLMTEDTLDIIDYEFAGYNDPGYDFGRVIAGLDYEVDEPKIRTFWKRTSDVLQLRRNICTGWLILQSITGIM